MKKASSALLFVLITACGATSDTVRPQTVMNKENSWVTQQREAMVKNTIEGRGVSDTYVLNAMRTVPRHELVPKQEQERAYSDFPLVIGYNQTISQPFIVASMTELAHVRPGDTVLEIGTGSGYQAAVLAEIGATVYTIEIVEPLAKRAAADLNRLGYGDRVHVRTGDGYLGWPEAGPFSAIIVTAAPDHIPQPLVEQLTPNGRMVIPIGKSYQELLLIQKTDSDSIVEVIYPVLFVPMTGKAQAK